MSKLYDPVILRGKDNVLLAFRAISFESKDKFIELLNESNIQHVCKPGRVVVIKDNKDYDNAIQLLFSFEKE